MSIVWSVVLSVLVIYLLLLVGRLILSWVQAFAHDWEPRGPLLVAAEAVMTATDPPLNLLRRFIPPLRLGSVALDLSFMVLFLVVLLLINVVPH